MPKNTNSSETRSSLNAPNHMQNNGVVGMPQRPQGQNFMPPFMQPQAMNAVPPFMNAPIHYNNHWPLQNNHMNMAHMGQPRVWGLGPQNSVVHMGQPRVWGLGPQNSVVGNASYNNPMFHVPGQAMQNAAQFNLSQQILPQTTMNMPQQPNMNMSVPSGQFRGPYPMQNMNQQLHPSQGVPYGMHLGSCLPMVRFPNQVPQGMVSQSSMFSTNSQSGPVPGNQVRPPRKNKKKKQIEGGFKEDSRSLNFMMSTMERRDLEKEHNGKGPNSGRVGQDGLRSEEHKQQPERSFSVTYNEQEIQQWREARKNNHPFNKDNQKLKEILAKQADLGVEVAEIPSYYLENSEYQGVQSEGRNKFIDKRSDRKDYWLGKKQKFADKDFLESPSLKKRKPTLLQKLSSADIKRDKNHLFQAFRFMLMNSFFKHWPDKPLRYPSVVVK